MKCPKCPETLVMTERQNIEIDYCPSCRGIWLDAGELDKIIQRSTRSNDRARDDQDNESWWERIFDIFD